VKRAWPVLFALVAGCTALRSLFPPDRPSFVPPEAVHVSGAHSRAIAVAYDDWMAHLQREKAERESAFPEDAGDGGEAALSPEVRALNECLDRPEAYQTWIHLSDAGTSYMVDVLPFYERCFGKDDRWLHAGGGAIYEIDARTFEILKKEVQE